MTGLLIKEKTGPAVERALDTETLKSKKREKTKTSEAMPLSKSEAVDHPRPPKTVLVAFPRAAPSNALPIDAFETQILHKIRTDRVTIIHGETGRHLIPYGFMVTLELSYLFVFLQAVVRAVGFLP